MRYLLILLSIINFNLFGQTSTEYPRIEKDSLGQLIVIMTIDQAQKLDNSTDLIPLFEKLNIDISNYDGACVKVINEQQQIIATQKMQIDTLKSQVSEKDEQIDNLKKQVENYKTDLGKCDEQKANNEEIINLQKDKIKKLKQKMGIGGTIGGIAIVVLVLAIIL